MVQALVFDVGETLINETRIWSRWADRLGVPRLTFMGVMGGMAALDRHPEEAFELIRPGIDLDAEIKAWSEEDPYGLRENFNEGDLYPDVRSSLQALRDAGYRLVIAGNQPPQAYGALVAMDLPVDAIYTSAAWEVEKPAPGFFDLVASAAGHEPEEILYVGDRLDNDVLPARRAGMRAALLRRGPWGYLHSARPEAAEADMVIDTLTDLAQRLPRHI